MDRLRTKRSARRAQNTKLLQEARSLLTDPAVDKAKLTGIYDRLSASNSELSKINDALEEPLADEELEAEYVAAAEYNDQAISMLAEIRCRVADLGRGDSTAATAPQNATPSAPDAPIRIGPRLPNLVMPTFRGDIHEWSAFWEQFEQTVYLNNALSTTAKFFYPRHYLAGEAAAAISGFPTSEACYADARELLKERFGDRKRIEHHHLSALRNLPHAKSGSDVRGLRRLYDAVQLNIWCLTALNVPTLSFSAMLIDILQKALPYDIVLAYIRGKWSQALRENRSSANVFEPAAAAASSESELKELLLLIRIELESREQCQPFSQRPVDDHAQRTRGNSTASVLHSTSCNWNECFFCKSKKHGTRACDATLPITSKKGMLAKDNRCYRCTSRGHQARSCPVKFTCSSCHGRHASSMCDPHYRKDMTVKSSRPVDASNRTEGMVSSQSVLLCDKATSNGCETDNSEVYLQTFRAFVIKNGRSRYVRGILDRGSQRSFVTEDLATKLNLQVVGETRVAFNTFGSASQTSAEKRRVVQVPLRSQYSTDLHIVRAIVVPVICDDILSPTADSHTLQQLRLEGQVIADKKKFHEAETENGISLLIGADQLWKITTGEVLRSKEIPGLVAIDTAFGWTLQGPSQQKASLDCDTNLVVCVLKVETLSDNGTIPQIPQQLEAAVITDSGEPHLHESIARFQRMIRKGSRTNKVELPCQDGSKQPLGRNHSTALTRPQKLSKKLWMKEGLLERYGAVVRQCVELGHAGVLPKNAPPHRDIYAPQRENMSGEYLNAKLQVMLHASSPAQGIRSLNDCLDIGANLKSERSIMTCSPFAPFSSTPRGESKFISLGAHWLGCWWDRFGRRVKSSLFKALGKSKLNSEETETVQVEVEAVANPRPITYTYAEAKELSAIGAAPVLDLLSLPTSPERTNQGYAIRSSQTVRHDLSKLQYCQHLVDPLGISGEKSAF